MPGLELILNKLFGMLLTVCVSWAIFKPKSLKEACANFIGTSLIGVFGSDIVADYFDIALDTPIKEIGGIMITGIPVYLVYRLVAQNSESLLKVIRLLKGK